MIEDLLINYEDMKDVISAVLRIDDLIGGQHSCRLAKMSRSTMLSFIDNRAG